METGGTDKFRNFPKVIWSVSGQGRIWNQMVRLQSAHKEPLFYPPEVAPHACLPCHRSVHTPFPCPSFPCPSPQGLWLYLSYFLDRKDLEECWAPSGKWCLLNKRRNLLKISMGIFFSIIELFNISHLSQQVVNKCYHHECLMLKRVGL